MVIKLDISSLENWLNYQEADHFLFPDHAVLKQRNR